MKFCCPKPNYGGLSLPEAIGGLRVEPQCLAIFVVFHLKYRILKHFLSLNFYKNLFQSL